jgi:predicted nucleotidyltransferase
MPRPKIELPREQIEEFCRRWKIVELSLFGSVLRDDFQPESDIDVLVSFAPDARRTLFDLVRIEDELADILGRKVDLVLKSGIERSENWIRRRAILESAQMVYVTR